MPHNICLQSGLTATDISRVQLLRTGTFTDMFGRDASITGDTLRALEANFNNNLRGIENTTGLPVDFSHMNGEKAAGWIRGVEFLTATQPLPVIVEEEEELEDGVFTRTRVEQVGEDGRPVLQEQEVGQLWVNIDWTPSAGKQIQDGEFKFISAEFMNTEEGRGAVLYGAGITNRPAVNRMKPIKLSKAPPTEDKTLGEQLLEITTNQHKEAEMSDSQNKVSAEQVTLAETQRKSAEAQFQLAAIETKLAAQKAELAEIEKQSEARKLEAKFDSLLSAGKAVPGQKEAFMKGDMVAFAEGAVELNLSASGVSADPKGHANDSQALLSEFEAEAQKLAKDGVSLSDAYTQVMKSDPKFTALASMEVSSNQPY